MCTTRKDTESFIEQAKGLISTGDWLLVKRTVNLQDIADIGITFAGVRSELLDLAVENYISGPEPDRDFPGEVWVFGKMILGKEIYIKLKIDQSSSRLTVISFHIANYPIDYPYRAD